MTGEASEHSHLKGTGPSVVKRAAGTIDKIVADEIARAKAAEDALDRRLAALEAPEPPPPPPPPDPTPVPSATMYRPVYGSAWQADAKDNRIIGRDGWSLSHRLRERGSSPVVGIAFNFRGDSGGNGYQGGHGGTVRIRKQASVSVGGIEVPSGVDLAPPILFPINRTSGGGWEDRRRLAVPNWPTVAGRLVHYVVEQADADPLANWCSVNETTIFDSPLEQPAFTDDYAVLVRKGTGAWGRTGDAAGNSPVMDVTYADGTHDGCAYFQQTVQIGGIEPQAIISGQAAVRQLIKPKIDIRIDSFALRLKRLVGASPLTLSLGQASGTVAASTAPISTSPAASGSSHWDIPSLSGGRWFKVLLPAPMTLVADTTYYLRGSCPANTTYMAIPVREAVQDTNPIWGSRAFGDGWAEKTFDGSSWVEAYDAYHDWQFYCGVAA